MNRTKTENLSVQITTDSVTLEGNLSLPEEPKGVVVFVHGSGSSRHSPRNQYVAQVLQEGRLATLLFDLLTAEEEQVDLYTRRLRFDIDLLARRTVGAVDWLQQQPDAQDLPVGLFGASTGAAAALIAASLRTQVVRAVVSRGGRPDLAGPALPRVKCPVLLIVGGLDAVVIDLNKRALALMPPNIEKKLVIVPGATHLFEEPGTLEQAARLARDWFRKYLK
jgi:pimeloyl-ACP methyl ester carboxylesterase